MTQSRSVTLLLLELEPSTLGCFSTSLRLGAWMAVLSSTGSVTSFQHRPLLPLQNPEERAPNTSSINILQTSFRVEGKNNHRQCTDELSEHRQAQNELAETLSSCANLVPETMHQTNVFEVDNIPSCEHPGFSCAVVINNIAVIDREIYGTKKPNRNPDCMRG